MIHPTAVVHPKARLHPSVRVGPCAVIDEGVELGPDCVVGPQCYLTGQTVAGARNVFHSGSVMGDAPQDLKYKGAPTELVIGDDNVFREHVTVHRSTKIGEQTRIGSGNLLMAGSHVGHNCAVGNSVIMANGALLAGHVTVGDRAFISGNCLVHQFTRVGTLSMMQGGAAISKDLPPFSVSVLGTANRLCGLNIIGLRRAGFTAAERLELKRLYRFLFRSGRNLREAVAAALADSTFASAGSIVMLEFVAAAKRGVCAHASSSARSEDEPEA